MVFFSQFETPVGTIIIVEEDEHIIRIDFSNRKVSGCEVETALIRKTKEELKEYFAGKRTCFTVPIKPKGTLFQQKVWQAIQTIPYGETRTYLEVAKKIGKEKAVRAVGNALHRNQVPIIIPCHRIVRKKTLVVMLLA